ncbi:alcohol oxidase [Dendrothele bispora CBS 962.96]|uniref:Alcohol oxidase n=1 Tax=Dendrothele bispora (strain CBS 962.96) TaxID=1314807 RepID=A0A4S8LQF2_DENBC|nr:alcohol oxidase [Dendrothele bispora CBS 962.96]
MLLSSSQSLSPSLKSILSLVLLLAVSTVHVRAALYTDPADLPTTEYDYIVVGAGTAGNVIANRLSEDSSRRVLVVEAGVDDTGIVTVHAPFLGPNNQQTLTDWNYTTVPQTGLNNRSITVPRGFVLGGSSSISEYSTFFDFFDFMVWTQGSSDLFDSYADASGDPGWGWDAIQPFWKKVSTLVPSPNNPTLPPPPSSDPTLSNGNGPVQIALPNFATELDYRVINASQILQSSNTTSDRFKYTQDMNGGDTIGFGFNQESTGGGERSSSATAYLWPALNERDNVDVVIGTRAMRLVVDECDRYNSQKRFGAVEVAQSVDGPRTILNATREIVLSAGSIGTPQLLLLSGIGPKDEVEAAGVESLVNLKGVGKNLVDHPLLLTYYSVSAPPASSTFDDTIRNPSLINSAISEWSTSRSGLFSTAPTSLLGFMRVPLASDEPDPSTGPKSAHTEILFLDGFAALGAAKQPSEGYFLSVITAVVSPTSRGSLLLDSTSGLNVTQQGTFSQPLIDYGIMSEEWDVNAMLQALEDADTFLGTEPWGAVSGLFNTTDSSSNSEQYIRENTISVYHPIGSAKMGKAGDKLAVVDERLRVRGGVKGVRVVDASVFPTIPECHPQAVIYTIAERAAELIKQDNVL